MPHCFYYYIVTVWQTQTQRDLMRRQVGYLYALKNAYSLPF